VRQHIFDLSELAEDDRKNALHTIHDRLEEWEASPA
jgi:hypothetical protein